MSYRFVTNFNSDKQPQESITHFIQIANFPNSTTKLYHIRKFSINSGNEFVDIKDYHLYPFQ